MVNPLMVTVTFRGSACLPAADLEKSSSVKVIAGGTMRAAMICSNPSGVVSSATCASSRILFNKFRCGGDFRIHLRMEILA